MDCKMSTKWQDDGVIAVTKLECANCEFDIPQNGEGDYSIYSEGKKIECPNCQTEIVFQWVGMIAACLVQR